MYKATTTSADPGYRPHGYLAEHSASGCCGIRGGNRKKRLQCLLLVGAVTCVACGLLLLGLSAAAKGGAAVAVCVLLALALVGAGAAMFTLHLRSQGRCNLPCWPSRAARLSSTLTEQPVAPPRSETQVTFAESAFKDERVKLMESSDGVEAEKIAESEPKIVLMA